MDLILNKDIRFLKGVGEKRAQQFYKLGVFTVQDLLYLFPRKYIDYSTPFAVAFAPFHEACVIKATVLQIGSGIRISGGRTMFKVICADDTARLTLTYFNSPYLVEKLKIGQDYLFYGKATGNMLNREMASPIFIPSDWPITQQPVYPLTAGLSTKVVSNTIKSAFDLVQTIPDFLPTEIITKFSFLPLYSALKNIHFATTNTMLEAAKKRLVFDEFFLLQLGLGLLGNQQQKYTNLQLTCFNIEDFLSSLPFCPTGAQLRAIQDIIQNFKSKNTMNRLLQGDVGSGKTLVGAAAMYCMAKNKVQSCMMAPTEILANQHYQNLKKLFANFPVKIALLTSSVKAKQKKEILQGLASGEIDILIGTHAILNTAVEFDKLGLCITDEQHRFGVKQRNLISQKGNNPHVLVMSATPIPRTLAMIIYGNMEISVINEMPKGRKPIQTLYVGTDKRARMFGFIDKHIQMGYQTYIVLPAIEESESLTDLQSVTAYCEEVVKPMLPHAKVGMLHGKMKPGEKEAVMSAFSNGELDLLCSTTVVEVGVDVPNAVLMIIENAERYGLSALHQLRGRVGRGQVQSYCILVSDHKGKNVQERLQFLCKNQDGFAVSQYDLDSRGPGDFFGSRQHGLPALKIAQLSQDITLLEQAQTAADYVLKKSPDLSLYPAIKQQVAHLFDDFTL